MKRVILFVLTNLAVILLISIITSLLGVNHWITAHGLDYSQLLVFCAVFGFIGSFISLAMSRWMAKQAFNIQVIDQPSTSSEEWLVETVRDLTSRAGLPMPEVGIYDSPEVNAFATGPSRNRALVAVSSGLLNNMNRDQAEGVLGHEVTHIANGDMVTMALLQGVLNTFVMFFARVIGFAIDQAMRRDDRDREGGVGFGYFIATWVCEIILGLLASLIVCAYSRRREFAADAGSAHLTGKEKMISALERLDQVVHQGGVLDDRAPAMAAFKINGRMGEGFSHLWMTHPPLEERIAALERLE